MSRRFNLVVDARVAGDLVGALDSAGFSFQEVKQLCEAAPLLRKLRPVIRGESALDLRENFIDANDPPSVFHPQKQHVSHIKVHSHRALGRQRWDASKLGLCLANKGQGSFIGDGQMWSGQEILEQIEGENLLNANFLHYLIEHPWHIPATWKDRAICVIFWGTIWSVSRNLVDEVLSVQYLYFDRTHERWDIGFKPLKDPFSQGNLPAAVFLPVKTNRLF